MTPAMSRSAPRTTTGTPPSRDRNDDRRPYKRSIWRKLWPLS
jgi:hypothetical protein